MQCLSCKTEFEAKRADAKFCSDSCRKAYKRTHRLSPTQIARVPGLVKDPTDKMGAKSLKELGHRSLKELGHPEPTPLLEGEHGHWFGKAPHRALWTTCTRENCAHASRQQAPDWEVTCTAPCCVWNQQVTP